MRKTALFVVAVLLSTAMPPGERAICLAAAEGITSSAITSSIPINRAATATITASNTM